MVNFVFATGVTTIGVHCSADDFASVSSRSEKTCILFKQASLTSIIFSNTARLGDPLRVRYLPRLSHTAHTLLGSTQASSMIAGVVSGGVVNGLYHDNVFMLNNYSQGHSARP